MVIKISKQLIYKISKSFEFQVIFLSISLACIYLDMQGFFLNDTSSDVLERLFDFRQHSYQYYINGDATTNKIYQELLQTSPALLPKLIAFLAKLTGNFNGIFFSILISLTSINIISLPYLVFKLTGKKYLLITLMLLMPTFSIPLSPDGPIAYGHGIIPITGYIGMNVLILLIGLIIEKKNKLILFIFSLLLFVIHPVIFVFFIPLVLAIYALTNLKKDLLKPKRNFLILTFISGLCWPIFISLILSFSKKAPPEYSYIVEWMSMHNFFIGYESFIVIFGFASVIYGLILVSDYVIKISPVGSLVGFLTSSYGVGVLLFNLLFVESHFINISSLIMPMRFESFMILILFTLLVTIVFSKNSQLNNLSRFIISLYISLCFYLIPGVYGQRGILLYLFPLLFLNIFNFKEKSLTSYSRFKQIIPFCLIFIIFLIIVPSSKLGLPEFNIFSIINNYLFESFTMGFKFIALYFFIFLILTFGLIISRNNLRKRIIKKTSKVFYTFLILYSPLVLIVFTFNLTFFKSYLNTSFLFQSKKISDEENLIDYIEKNISTSDSILQHPELPFFRRRLPHSFSLDKDLISIFPYAPHYINYAMCELESTYRVEASNFIKKGTKRWHNKKNSYKSFINWELIKNYHLNNKKINNLSENCDSQEFTIKSFKYLLEPITEGLSNKQKIIFSNEKYRLSEIVR